jgi:hypothetical protein
MEAIVKIIYESIAEYFESLFKCIFDWKLHFVPNQQIDIYGRHKLTINRNLYLFCFISIILGYPIGTMIVNSHNWIIENSKTEFLLVQIVFTIIFWLIISLCFNLLSRMLKLNASFHQIFSITFQTFALSFLISHVLTLLTCTLEVLLKPLGVEFTFGYISYFIFQTIFATMYYTIIFLRVAPISSMYKKLSFILLHNFLAISFVFLNFFIWFIWGFSLGGG